MWRKKTLVLVFVLVWGWFLVTGYGCGGGFPVPDMPDKVVGYCVYKNAFSGLEECKEYVGGWTVKEATDDCRGNGSTIVMDRRCGHADDKRYGDCIFIIDKKKEKYARVELPGTDSSRCGSMERGCEFFGGGSFVPAQVCGGKSQNNSNTNTPNKLPVFQPGKYVCQDPKAGDPPGKGPNGQVCTMVAISGATEPGRDFEIYGDCNLVRTQRPYYPVPPYKDANKDDPRGKDPAYAKESEWVKSQIRATACVCCHTTSAPQGPSNWYLESKPNWVNSMSDRGLALGAGWISAVGFGAYPPDKTNGFTRPTPDNPEHSAFTTTDDARMRRFFEAELKHRGRKREDFKDEKYGAGPLDVQRLYQPKDCTGNQSIAKDGTMKWFGGPARYLYVMEATSSSPGVPPNLDTPKGTLWRVDVERDGTPIKSGTIQYGVVPAGAKQKVPVEGAPPRLKSGKKYYLYVLKDIANPLTRCLVTAP